MYSYPVMNHDVPHFDVWIRKEFLYDEDETYEGEFVKGVVFGIRSLHGRALGFHTFTDVGAVIWGLPIHALCHDVNAPYQELNVLELWDCFAYQVTVTEFTYLSERACMVILRDHLKYEGEYLFTVDWFGTSEAESAGDGGHKCGHLIALENGNFALQPNNRILWADPALISVPYGTVPDYRTTTSTWKCEGTSKWSTDDSSRMFYSVKENPGGTGTEGVRSEGEGDSQA
jgi:hypothetical protein